MTRYREKKSNKSQRMVDYNAEDINGKLIINLRDLGHIMRLQYEGKASQKRILIILHEVGSITQRQLTERLGIQPGSASEVIIKLENAGLIVRTQNLVDRRTTDIQLTDSGKMLALEAVKQRKQRHEEMFSCLSKEEKQELLLLMEKLHADWELRYQKDGFTHGHNESPRNRYRTYDENVPYHQRKSQNLYSNSKLN